MAGTKKATTKKTTEDTSSESTGIVKKGAMSRIVERTKRGGKTGGKLAAGAVGVSRLVETVKKVLGDKYPRSFSDHPMAEVLEPLVCSWLVMAAGEGLDHPFAESAAEAGELAFTISFEKTVEPLIDGMIPHLETFSKIGKDLKNGR